MKVVSALVAGAVALGLAAGAAAQGPGGGFSITTLSFYCAPNASHQTSGSRIFIVNQNRTVTVPQGTRVTLTYDVVAFTPPWGGAPVVQERTTTYITRHSMPVYDSEVTDIQAYRCKSATFQYRPPLSPG